MNDCPNCQKNDLISPLHKEGHNWVCRMCGYKQPAMIPLPDYDRYFKFAETVRKAMRDLDEPV